MYPHGTTFTHGISVGVVTCLSDEFGISTVFGGEEDLGRDIEYRERFESIDEIV